MRVDAIRLAISPKAAVAIEALAIEHQHLAIGTCSHQQLALLGGGQVTELQLTQHMLPIHHKVAIDHAEEDA